MKRMHIHKTVLTVTAYFLLAGAVSGCSGNNSEDLETYVAKVKGQQRGFVKPLPEFIPYETYLYQAQQKRDPFTPSASAAPKTNVVQAGDNGIAPDLTRAREPLEAEPLDSMRMVGTLERKGDSWALIRMNDTTIHRVKPGNHIGQNHGKIIRVTESNLELTEIVADGLGGWVERTASLALSE